MSVTVAGPGQSRRSTWPFVARGVDVDVLGEVLAGQETDVVHLVGPSGVGKTRLATALLSWAERDGSPVAVVRASRGAAELPLASLVNLLGTDVLSLAPAALVAAAVEVVRDRGDGSRVVVMVDDVNLLDPASLTVLGHLVGERLVQLVTTARDDAPTPDLLLAALRHGRLHEVQVRSLHRREVVTLAHLALEGTISAPLEQGLWELSAGNPLFLRELVSSGRDTGAIDRVDGVWSLVAPLATPRSLRDLVADRFGDLPDDARTVLEILALCVVVALEDVEEVAGHGTVEWLEESGLVEAESDADGLWVRLAHPLYGQVLREATPSLRARRLLLEQIARAEARSPRPTDTLHLVRWRLKATGDADPALLLRAARLARVGHDHAEVERLCRVALASGEVPEARALLAEAAAHLGRAEEAETGFAATLDRADPALGAELALARAVNLFLGLGRLDDAVEWLDATVATPPGVRPLLLAMAGRTSDASVGLGAFDEVHDEVHDEVLTRARCLVLLQSGRVEQARDAAGRGLDLPPDAHRALHPDGALGVAALAALAAGDLQGAADATEQGLQLAGLGSYLNTALLRWLQAAVALCRGDLAGARSLALEVRAASEGSGFPLPGALAAATAATATAMCSEPVDASLAAALAEADPRPYAPWVQVARGWVLAAQGSAEECLTTWREQADDHLGLGNALAACDLLHEAVRLGDRQAARRLLEVGESVDGPLARVRLLHAEGVAEASAEHLVRAAEGFADLGWRLLAAEAASAVTRTAEVDRRDATRAAALAARERQLCPGASTPALGEVRVRALLTRREHQIATMVAAGRTSKEVAEALVLSVRTVDNHLQNIYTKLGIASRDRLADAVAALQDPSGEGSRP